MGLNTLNDVVDGDTIFAVDPNSIHQALNGSFVGRSGGVPSAGQDLGTAAIPWGTGRFNSISVNGSAIDPSQLAVPQNRVLSGATRTTSRQPAYLVPNGAALSFVVDGTPTTLAYDVNGTSYQLSADLTKGSLTAAPSTQNTALINDTTAAGQFDTKLWGEPEHAKSITIDTAGTNITALVGKFAAFKLAGVTDEYFMAYVESATKLSRCRRGYFYDSGMNPVNRSAFSNNDVLTLLKLGWVFLDRDATTIDVSYNNPVWGFVSPNSPATGDYWYDMANNVWKRYDGADFVTINRTFIGNVINTTTACVAARCVDFFFKYSDINTMRLQVSTTEIVIAEKPFQKVSVCGTEFNFQHSLPSWNITTDLSTGSNDLYDETEQASRLYYLYISDRGEPIISDISPYYREDFQGRYHPHNPWRMVGAFYNDGSSNIIQAGGVGKNTACDLFVHTGNGYGAVDTVIRRHSTVGYLRGWEVIYLDSANNGSHFVFNDTGFAMFVRSAVDSGGAQDVGISISCPDADLTTAIQSLTGASLLTRKALAYATDGEVLTIGARFPFKIGDIGRCHDQGLFSSANNQEAVTITVDNTPN